MDTPDQPTDRPTVFVVDDDPIVCQFLESVLTSADMRVETYRTAIDFLTKYEPKPWECLIVDLRLPDLDGLELQRRLLRKIDGIPVIVMTGFGSTATAVESMKLGAVDYIEKPLLGDKLLTSVRAALEKDREAKRVRKLRSEVQARLERLTPREREVLALVVAGHSSRSIADQLGLSKKTIDLHRSHVMRKLGAETVVDLVTMVLTGRKTERQESVETATPPA